MASCRLRRVVLVATVCVIAGFVSSPQAAEFRRGDANSDGSVNVSDALFSLLYLFSDGERSTCADAADANDDGRLNIADPVFTLFSLFVGDRVLPPPSPDCGDDPTDDALDCTAQPPCDRPSGGRGALTEFMAVNTRTLRDGRSEFSDWFEITNVGDGPLDLAGHFVTDDRDLLDKWMIPAGPGVVLDPNEAIVIFASGQDSDDFVDSRGFIHTNFELGRRGEFLALVAPDGSTIVSSIGPGVPEQTADVSYGRLGDTEIFRELIGEDSPARALAPAALIAANWVDIDFDDSEWTLGEIGFGYETEERGVFSGKFEADVEPLLHEKGSSLILRASFDLEADTAIEELTLWVRYSGGFIAYLNGSEIARENAPAEPSHDATAPAPRPDGLAVTSYAPFDVSAHVDRLVPGRNLLAVHAFAESSSDARFLVVPVLEARVRGAFAVYLREPTPGEPNATGYLGRVRDTTFSIDRGFFSEPAELAITSGTPGATVRFTTDGGAPTESSGELHSAPLAIEKTMVVRAIAARDGFLPTDVDTQSYLFLEGPGGVLSQAQTQPGYPTAWAGIPADYEMDPEIVEHPDYAATIAGDLQSIPTLSLVLRRADFISLYNNPQGRGIATERPVSMEYFTADGAEELQENAGMRMHGGAGRQPEFPKHSFRLLFRRRYGASKLRYSLFRGEPYGGGATSTFDKLILRGGFNNTFPHWYDEQALRAQYVRDQWARDLQFEMGHLSPRGRYVHLYINGLYWGLYNVTERPDEDFGATYYGGAEEDYDVIKNRQSTAGTRAGWNRLVTLASNASDPAAYEEASELCDFENLIDYLLEGFYFGNTDWDHNNQVAMRRRDPPSPFQFLSWDAEFAISLAPGAQPNQWAPILTIDRSRINTANGPSGIFQGLRQNEEFRVLLADRIHRHFFGNGVLTPERVREIWMRRANEVHRPIVGESARWGDFRRDVFSRRDPRNAFPLFTRNEQVAEHQRWILEEYFPTRTDRVIGQFRAARYLPDVRAPSINPAEGVVDAGTEVSIRGTTGRTYYTIDGTDPREKGGDLASEALLAGDSVLTPILVEGAPARAFVPVDDSLGLEWTELGFDDGDWIAGSSGVGYEESSGYEDLILLDVGPDMFEKNGSAYIRLRFDVASVDDFDLLTLRMKYDDGFVAYLNGVEVARRNAPDDLAWNSEASFSHGDSRAKEFENIDITEHRDSLRLGENLLAIHGLNRRTTNNDFLIVPVVATSDVAEAVVAIDATTHVKARILLSEEWSPLAEAVYVVDAGIRVTEVMYHPANPDGAEEAAGFDDDDEFEFLEIANLSALDRNLDGFEIASGIRFAFSDAALAPGERAVIVRDRAGFEARYGVDSVRILGEYDGGLSNDRDEIQLLDDAGRVLLSFTYNDEWHPTTDGDGHSLVLVNPDARGDPDSAEDWRPSRDRFGSPGASE